MRVDELKPGMLFRHEASSDRYVFVGLINPHPLYAPLVGVIWFRFGFGYIIDSLALKQEIEGEEVSLLKQDFGDQRNRVDLLKIALLTYQQSRI